MAIQILEYWIENRVSSSKSSNCKLPEGEKHPCPVLSLCLVLLDHTNPIERNKATALPGLSVWSCMYFQISFVKFSSYPKWEYSLLSFNTEKGSWLFQKQGLQTSHERWWDTLTGNPWVRAAVAIPCILGADMRDSLIQVALCCFSLPSLLSAFSSWDCLCSRHYSCTRKGTNSTSGHCSWQPTGGSSAFTLSNRMHGTGGTQSPLSCFTCPPAHTRHASLSSNRISFQWNIFLTRMRRDLTCMHTFLSWCLNNLSILLPALDPFLTVHLFHGRNLHLSSVKVHQTISYAITLLKSLHPRDCSEQCNAAKNSQVVQIAFLFPFYQDLLLYFRNHSHVHFLMWAY